MEYYENLVGDGETTIFYFTFAFFGVKDVHVKIDGVEQTTDTYTITPTITPNDADTEYTGGKIEFAIPPAIDAAIVIYRDIELVRHIDYQPTLQPKSCELNQDFNQCMGALREFKIKLQNVLNLADIPTLSDLLTELATIRAALPDLVTTEDMDELDGIVADIGDAVTALNEYDYVIESQLPTSENNYTWYRKYKSGWVEQGGNVSTGGSGNKTINLPVAMANTEFCPVVTRISGASTTSNVNVWSRRPTVTTKFVIYASDDTGVVWQVSGTAAQ